jgi:hypothetical protein
MSETLDQAALSAFLTKLERENRLIYPFVVIFSDWSGCFEWGISEDEKGQGYEFSTLGELNAIIKGEPRA